MLFPTFDKDLGEVFFNRTWCLAPTNFIGICKKKRDVNMPPLGKKMGEKPRISIPINWVVL